MDQPEPDNSQTPTSADELIDIMDYEQSPNYNPQDYLNLSGLRLKR